MKRFSKILVAVLALCLLVGVLALTISADTGVTGQFAVNGEGYNTWEDAVAAAGDTHTIYLNGDWTVDSTIAIATNTKINLNGKTVNATAAPVFKVTSGAELVLEGKGTVNATTAFVEASGTDTTVTVNADGAGNGIVINSPGTDGFTAFRVYDRAILNVSGLVEVTAASPNRIVIDARLNGSAKGAAKIDIFRAKFSATGSAFAYFIRVDADVTIDIKDSELSADYARIIDAIGPATYKDFDASSYKTGAAWNSDAAENVKFDDLNVILNAKNSKFVSGPTTGTVGTIMKVHTYMDAKFTDCIFYADYRPIVSDGSTGVGTAINQHQLLFTDCHFFKHPNAAKAERFFMTGVNYKIIGGSYSFASTFANGSAAYLELANGRWVGGYADNVATVYYHGVVKTPADEWQDATYFPGGAGTSSTDKTNCRESTVKFCIDGEIVSFTRSYFSDDAKYQALVAKSNSLTDAVIIVDGTGYASVAAANAQIKENSVVELIADVTEPIAIKADVKVKTNGYDVYGFVSDTYKPVNHEALGLYTFAEASENEKITITYEYGTTKKEQTVVKGTVVPEMTEAFTYQIVDNTITFVNGWEVPALDYSDADQLENGVTATPTLDTQILKFFANGKNFDTLEAAMAGANGETITIYEDEITISSTIAIDTNTKINLNGKTVNATAAPVFKVTSGAELVLEGKGTVNATTAFVEASGTNTTVTVNADGAGNGIVINSPGTNGFTAFRVYDRAILNVSGLVEVTAASANRIVIDARLNGSAKGAAKIDIFRAKLSATGSAFAYLIRVDADVTIDIKDSELSADYARIIDAIGPATYKDFDASSYKNGPTWLEGAAENVKFDDLNVILNAKNSKFVSGPTTGTLGTIMKVHTYMDAKFTDCIFYADYRPIVSEGDTGDGTAINQHQLLFTDCHFFMHPNAAKAQRFFMTGVNYKIVGGSYSFAQQIAQGSAAYLELTDAEGNPTGQWVGGYMDNTLLSVNFPINNVAGEWNDFTHFPDYENSLKTSTVSVIIDGAKHTFIWGRFSDADKYAALVEDSKNVDSYVITVDGVGYASVEAANAQIKENSIVVLVKDVKEPIEINYNNVKFKANGKTYPGFVSAAYTTVDYSAARGAIYSTPADESEIFTIEYSEYDGITGQTQTAVLGTLLKAPSAFDEYKRILDKEAGKYTELTWTLTEGETVVKVTGNGTAYPVVTETDAVIVNWTDDKGEVLDTDYYFPGENTVLDEFDGTDIAVNHDAEYYGVGRVGWSGLEDATTGLATSGTYTITAVIGKVAPDTFPGLKYNLSLYSNYVLNFYIPAGLENKGVSNLTISEYEDGSIFFNKFASGMLGGVEYDRYGYVVGIADTELKSYYIVYYVDETQITFEVKNIGTPYYAYQVMEEYKDKNDAKSELTKTLVVNMANYADKVLDVAKDDKSSLGAQFYTNILTNYGDQYLGYYNGLTDNRFASTGDGNDIYQSDVADLNWITKTGDAISYVESISFNFNTFEPTFIIKLSETAVNQGICKPEENGMANYQGKGLHIQTGFYSSAYAQIWAEDATGEKLDGTADVWGDSTSTAYNYYVSANNNGAYKESGNWLNSANMLQYFRNDLNIDVYYAAEDGVDPSLVGRVNYSLAAYINSMVDSANAANYTAEIEAAKALYAFSLASEMYKAAN